MTLLAPKTSFNGLFSLGDAEVGMNLNQVEIPLIQRDYAQGRQNTSVDEIRDRFLEVLVESLSGSEPRSVNLDFIYGEAKDGVLGPLDGQQRLTTLFLLHWYLASRAGRIGDELGWKNFSYATRPSARLFCERLAQHGLPNDQLAPGTWVQDQAWYLFVWRHDPTIQGMIVMLDAIHRHFVGVNASVAWERLIDQDNPAITFLLLPLSEMGSASELYIKMNSRGKPLTEFENFKARFEKLIENSSRSAEFAKNIDGVWSELLWEHRDDADVTVDDEFMRYVEFVIEICEWRDGEVRERDTPLIRRAESVFGSTNPKARHHLDFLFDAFDAWSKLESVAELFDELFVSDVANPEAAPAALRLYFRESSVNLFNSCCRSYGEFSGRTRVFTLGQTLILYGVLLHLVHGSKDFAKQLRTLRNLIEASANELREENMPELLTDVSRLVLDASIEGLAALNQAQVAHENEKLEFATDHPELVGAIHALEDHDLLRGSLAAFELAPDRFEQRAAAFQVLMADAEHRLAVSGALLATGEYQRMLKRNASFRFGPGDADFDAGWRALFATHGRGSTERTQEVLGRLLDRIAETEQPLKAELDAIQAEFLEARRSEQALDWRYYMVKHPAMRELGSSIYYTEDREMGYSLCMLRGGIESINSHHRDPYVLAVYRAIDDPEALAFPYFEGYVDELRWLQLNRSGARVRFTDSGIEVSKPPLTQDADAFEATCEQFGIGDDGKLDLEQIESDGRRLDAVQDRIEIAVELTRELINAGL